MLDSELGFFLKISLSPRIEHNLSFSSCILLKIYCYKYHDLKTMGQVSKEETIGRKFQWEKELEIVGLLIYFVKYIAKYICSYITGYEISYL